MRISGLRRLAVVAALAAGVVLALSVMPACSLFCTTEQDDYLGQVEDWADSTTGALTDLQAILYEVDRQQGTSLDDGWRRRLKRVMDELIAADEEMMNVEVPAGAEEAHRVLVRLGRTHIEALELLWQGVRDEDTEALLRAYERQLEATRLVNELLEAAERICL
ncbi:MAG: hypothetical protein OXG11_09820 [Chloroflexi bacterium]|nr:hypothetical protein [Chloroflexota bacterium]